MTRRPARNGWYSRHQRLMVAGVQVGIVVFAVTLAWWISRPAAGMASASAQMPRARGPASIVCGPSAVPRQPPPMDSPFGVQLFASSPLGMVHPLRAISMVDSLVAPEPALDAAPQEGVIARDGDELARPPRNDTAHDDVETVSRLLQEYRSAFGAMPVGEMNDEIVRRLQGENPRGLAVLPKAHSNINAAGELVDRWGTPYRFHPESSWMMTVRSAGPDKRMWSSDDIVSMLESPPAANGPVTAGLE
jgi:hypothetical protein